MSRLYILLYETDFFWRDIDLYCLSIKNEGVCKMIKIMFCCVAGMSTKMLDISVEKEGGVKSKLSTSSALMDKCTITM